MICLRTFASLAKYGSNCDVQSGAGEHAPWTMALTQQLGMAPPVVLPVPAQLPKSCANPEQVVDSARSNPAAARCKQFAVHSLPIWCRCHLGSWAMPFAFSRSRSIGQDASNNKSNESQSEEVCKTRTFHGYSNWPESIAEKYFLVLYS